MENSMDEFHDQCRLILDELSTTLAAVDSAQVEALVETLSSSPRVFFIGVGRVMLAMQAMAKRLNHLGIHAHCVGDINEPAIAPGDALVVASGSGESVVPLAIARVAKAHGARIVHIGSNPNSSLAPLTDLFVRVPVRTKLGLPSELPSAQPMSSLFEQSLLLLGDAVALMIVKRRGLNVSELWPHHANLE
jgi:6-phospho-3-hexuloisomerase